MIKKIIALCLASFTLSAADMEQAFETVKKDPIQLRDFLYRMPKGGDLHNHLDGSVYAESLIVQAAQENMCVDEKNLGFVKSTAGKCLNDQVPVSDALTVSGGDLYTQLIRSLSMHDFTPGSESAGEHFFATFPKFLTLNQSDAEWAHEVLSRAAAQNEQYVELMITVPCGQCEKLSQKINNPPLSSLSSWDFSEDVAKAQQFIQDIEKKRLSLGDSHIKVRYIFKAFRGFPNETVYPQLAFAFQLLDAESKMPQPLMVGFNLVMRESGYLSMKHYTDQMKALGFLKKRYPHVRVSLHAGELTFGLVPPEALTFHINEAVHLAGAQRIGHGTSIVYEKNHIDLLKHMAAQHIAVEVIPSSAKVILGVQGDHHPLRLYLDHNVPVVIASDDEGVLRSDLTHEFQMAVEQHNLTYADLKKIVRNSLEYSFLPGDSLWIDHDYQRLHPACQQDKPSSNALSTSCQQLIKSSEKAERQWVLEKRLYAFESKS